MPQLLNSHLKDLDLVLNQIEAAFPNIDARKTGTLINTIAGVASMLARDAKRHAIREVSKTFFTTAQGADLDRLAEDHIDLYREEASSATGQITLQRATATITIIVPAGAILKDEDGAQYAVIDQTTIAGLEGTIPVQAVETGTTTNRPAYTEFTPDDSTWLQGETATFQNTEPISGGNETEIDDEFRERIASWWLSLRRGTKEALIYVARSVEGVRLVGIDESHVPPANGGYVDLFVTDAAGNPNEVMLQAVRTAIDWEGKAAGVVVNISGGELTYIEIDATLTLHPGAPTNIKSLVAENIIKHLATLTIGDTLTLSELHNAILSTDDSIASAHITKPVANIQPNPNQLLRTTADKISLA